MKTSLLTSLLLLAVSVGVSTGISAQEALPKSIIAIHASVGLSPKLDVVRLTGGSSVQLIPIPSPSFEGMIQTKLRVFPHWYAVAGIGVGGYSHGYELDTPELPNTGFGYIQFPTFHLITSLGVEYHTALTARTTLFGGVHLQNNYYVQQTLGSSNWAENASGVPVPIVRFSYDSPATNALAVRTHLGVLWAAGKRVALGLSCGYMYSNFNALEVSSYTLFEDAVAVETGRLSQYYRFGSLDFSAAYRFNR
ncbi:MAG: hypothetical protein R2795_16020 [Saprospiraceae bacterium]